jgi:negative regulator of flagellin synthesis FlgM
MSYSNEIGAQWALSPISITETKQTNSTVSSTKSNENLSASSEQTDQARLSSMGGLVAQALGDSDVRMDKVTALQQAIASGSYSVSSSDVADKVIHSLLE